MGSSGRVERHEVIEILDGRHPSYGRHVAFALQGLIIVSAIAIAVETVPGLTPEAQKTLFWIEVIVLASFCIEYVIRVVCAPQPLRYIFSFWGMVDLLACLPALALLQTQWAAVRTLRLLRLIRLLKLVRTSKALDRMQRAMHHARGELSVFFVLAAMMLYVAAVGIYVFENPAQPDQFTSIPMSLWWAVATFTTVGYGDLVPITVGGRIFTSLVLFIGLGVVAVPAAIITRALVDTELDEIRDEVERIEDTEKRPTRRPPRPKK